MRDCCVAAFVARITAGQGAMERMAWIARAGRGRRARPWAEVKGRERAPGSKVRRAGRAARRIFTSCEGR